MTFKSRVISERQRAVIETIRMRLTERQALFYLKEVGFEMSDTTLYREKAKLEKMKLKRLYHIAQIGFQDQHLDRIDQIEICLKFLWENYHKEQDPFKKFQMAKDIILVQPYLSSYYEATKDIIIQQPEYQELLRDNNNHLQQHEDEKQIREDREEFSRLDNYKTYYDDYNDNRKF